MLQPLNTEENLGDSVSLSIGQRVWMLNFSVDFYASLHVSFSINHYSGKKTKLKFSIGLICPNTCWYPQEITLAFIFACTSFGSHYLNIFFNKNKQTKKIKKINIFRDIISNPALYHRVCSVDVTFWDLSLKMTINMINSFVYSSLIVFKQCFLILVQCQWLGSNWYETLHLS